MTRTKPTRDIQPVTEFRARAAQFIDQVRETGAPMVLTQYGRSAAVLIDVRQYESLMDELDVLRDVRTAEQDVDAGRGRPHAEVARRLRARAAK